MVQTRRGTTAIKHAVKTPTKAKREVSKASSPPPSKKSPAKSPKPPPAPSKLVNGKRLLFSLRDDDELLEATLVARPSKRNKSPYVGDIELVDAIDAVDNNEHHPVIHLPNLDMGGKCRPGVQLLVKPARDRKGVKVCATATGKYGTPKCQYICQLLHVDESSDGKIKDEDNNSQEASSSGTVSSSAASATTLYPPIWIGAHPSLGERIAEVWLREGLIEGMPPISSLQRQVTKPAGADMRADFMVQHADGSRRIVEIKTVVDTDYAASHAPSTETLKCVYVSDKIPYQRTAIFPWGNSKQKGPDGEKVVSARAIHHVGELTKLAQGSLREEGSADWDGTYQATLLFVVIRGDAMAFRPNHEACPSFARYLKQAKDNGVQVLAKRVKWGTTKEEWGHCFDDTELSIEWDA